MAEHRRRKSDRRDHPAPVDEGTANERFEQRLARGPDSIPYGVDDGLADYEKDVTLGSHRPDLEPMDEIDELEREENDHLKGGSGRDY